MKKLQAISKQLPTTAKLSEQQLETIKGGRRYITEIKSWAEHHYNALKSQGFPCSMSEHDGKYCVEW